ncbi:MAG: hypothetical protein ABSH28_15610, partial [Acidobacteriota bacterium]
MGLQKPIATATAIVTPIPIPMIATQREHDLHPAPHFYINCPAVCELISNLVIAPAACNVRRHDAAFPDIVGIQILSLVISMHASFCFPMEIEWQRDHKQH